jgi:hypothetical protein
LSRIIGACGEDQTNEWPGAFHQDDLVAVLHELIRGRHADDTAAHHQNPHRSPLRQTDPAAPGPCSHVPHPEPIKSVAVGSEPRLPE